MSLMSVRAAFLFCCIAGVTYAQDTPQSPDQGSPQQPPAGQVEPQTPQVNPKPPRDGQKKDGQKSKSGKPAKNSPNPDNAKAGAPPPATPTQKLLDALDAAIRQPVNGAARPDMSELLSREDQLKSQLVANGDLVQISREATRMLVSLYGGAPQAAPPADDDKRGRTDPIQAYLVPILVIGILVAIMSPLLCVAGFWWAGRIAETALRKGLRDAGLL